MKKMLIPCLWFNDKALEAANFYCDLFGGKITSSDDGSVRFNLRGRSYTALNGGPQHQINESISFMVYCGTDKEIERINEALMEAGEALMEMGAYPWSRRYAWVKDKFGVSWQLDVDSINNKQDIVPSLMFVNDQKYEVKHAINYYHKIFPNCQLLMKSEFEPSMKMPKGTLNFAQHKIDGNIFNFMSSHLETVWNISSGISFVIQCEDQQEIDHYWEELTRDGEANRCGWLKDKYGISWQVIPDQLSDLLNKPEGMSNFLQMTKIKIAEF